MAKQFTKNRTLAARTYLYVVGVALTVFVCSVQFQPEWVGLSHRGDWAAFMMLGLFAIITRFLSIEAPVRQISITLDTPVYLTAVLTLGAVQGSFVCFVATIFWYGWRIILRFRKPTVERRELIDLVGVGIYASAMTTTVIFVLCVLFRTDFQTDDWSQAPHYGVIPVIGFFFLLCQYSLAVVPYTIRGVSVAKLVKHVVIPALIVEVILLQLAVLAVITYQREDLTPFLLLATCYLFVNYVIRRLSQISTVQTRKVAELEALNRLGQTVCSTMESKELVERFSSEALTLFTQADAFVLNYGAGEGGSIVTTVLGRDPEDLPSVDERAATAIAQKARMEGRVFRESNPKGSWLVCPITIKEESLGSVLLWSATKNAFGDEDMGFFGTLATQASFALENVRLYDLATVDSLTGLYLRRFFEERLGEEFARVDRYDGSCAVIAMDLDWLKNINDNMGHAMGDNALKHVARVMREQTRVLDVPARLGGDEFVILLPNVDAKVARSIAERIRESIANTPISDGSRQLTVTVSMGIASYPEHTTESPEVLLELADKALYQSKTRPKRNTVEVFQVA